jgi:hypothetical protein
MIVDYFVRITFLAMTKVSFFSIFLTYNLFFLLYELMYYVRHAV